MRLQKQKTREINGKEYFRYAVIIPPSKVKELGWKDGQVLKQKLVIEKD